MNEHEHDENPAGEISETDTAVEPQMVGEPDQGAAVIAVDPPAALDSDTQVSGANGNGDEQPLEEWRGEEHPGETEESAADLPPVESPFEALTATLGSLDTRLEESQRLQARQADLADRLHAENQRLRVGELRAAQLPLVRHLLRLFDDLGRMLESAGEQSPKDLAVVRESLLDALAGSGIFSFLAEPGTPFDAKQHSAVGVVATDDQALDRSVVTTARAGFRWEDDQLVRVADVRVFKYQEPHEQDAQSQ